jgi:hypothetical protein
MATIDTITNRPESGMSAGDAYFETSSDKIVVWTGSAWTEIASDNSPSSFTNAYSVDFDGTNDIVSGPAVGTTVGTCSMWFYNDDVITTTSTGQVLLNTAGYHFGIVLGNQTGLTNELISMQYKQSNVWRAIGYTGSGLSLTSGWHHVMIAWVSNSSTNPGNAGYDFWLDGVKVGNSVSTAPTAPESLASAGNGFHLGARFGSGSIYRPFDGRIDEFALWSGDVSGDIANIYNSGAGAVDLNSSGVVGTAPEIWWRMGDDDGGTGTTITNQGSLGSSADGTLVNGPTFSTDIPS